MSQNTSTINRWLLPYAGVQAVLVIIALLPIMLRDGHPVDGWSGLALVPSALYYMFFIYIIPTSKNALNRTRFGALVAHALTFLLVNLGYHMLAGFYVARNFAANDGEVVLSNGWFGVLFAMFCVWGLGLLIHMIASIGSRGYEQLAD